MSARPQLPLDCQNPKIPALLTSPGSIPPVKYQVLNSSGIDVLVARLKIEIPGGTGHAFILRRFDTKAISATTMFRAAFPTASSAQESTEMTWVKGNYSTDSNNGSKTDSTIPRLAGTWLSPADALRLAGDYHILELVRLIAEAEPEPSTNYRRSKAVSPTKPPSATQSPTSIVPKSLPPLASSRPMPSSSIPPAKRRREASPIAAPASTKAPRRSMRATKSPPPTSGMSTLATVTPQGRVRATPRSTKHTTLVQPSTPFVGSDETAVDEETDAVVNTAAGEGLRKQDIAEQHDLISALKAQRTDIMATSEKREREEDDAPLTLNIKEPEIADRAIASNRRVRGLNLETRQKSFAWGVAAFAVGFGAVSYLPNFL